jgi:hypothetical protein
VLDWLVGWLVGWRLFAPQGDLPSGINIYEICTFVTIAMVWSSFAVK